MEPVKWSPSTATRLDGLKLTVAWLYICLNVVGPERSLSRAPRMILLHQVSRQSDASQLGGRKEQRPLATQTRDA